MALASCAPFTSFQTFSLPQSSAMSASYLAWSPRTPLTPRINILPISDSIICKEVQSQYVCELYSHISNSIPHTDDNLDSNFSLNHAMDHVIQRKMIEFPRYVFTMFSHVYHQCQHYYMCKSELKFSICPILLDLMSEMCAKLYRTCSKHLYLEIVRQMNITYSCVEWFFILIKP